MYFTKLLTAIVKMLPIAAQLQYVPNKQGIVSTLQQTNSSGILLFLIATV
jgi:hypothetical protein